MRERKTIGTAAQTEPKAEPQAGSDLRTLALQRRASQRKAAKSGGEPLGEDVQNRMQPHFGASLDGVRVHRDAGEAADLEARAFSDGKDVHFGAGQYRPGTREGDRLIAHELSHAVEGDGGLHRKKDEHAAAEGDDAAAEKKADDKSEEVAGALHDEPKKAPAPELKAGATGITNKEVTVKLGGKETKLPSGTVVKIGEVIGDEKQLKVTVYSGFGGKEATLERADFDFEPGVATDEDTDKERDDHYEEYKGSLWGKDGPKPDDIHQGYIGDCYVMAAMGAVVARDPGAIKARFSPQTPDAKCYQVTLFVRGDGGKLEETAFSVDTKLPTQKDAPQDPAYANNDHGGGPLWPALLEKAYAQMLGGYAKEGEGGNPGDAMEAFTGSTQDKNAMPEKEKVIETFKTFEKQGKAVDVSTNGSVSRANQKPFKGKHGKLEAHLTGDEGQDIELVKSSLTLEDHTSKNHLFVFDDGNGKIEQKDVVDGTVDYGKGDVSLDFHKGKAPDDPKNLEASYDYRGLISKEYNLYANHAYIFEKTQGDALILKNPWGMGEAYDPKPIPAAAFVKFFNDVASTTVVDPKDEKKK